MQYFIVFKAFT